MFKAERMLIENGSAAEMRNAFRMAASSGQRFGGLGAVIGFAVASMRRTIKPYSEGNYLLSEKGERLQLQMQKAALPRRP